MRGILTADLSESDPPSALVHLLQQQILKFYSNSKKKTKIFQMLKPSK